MSYFVYEKGESNITKLINVILSNNTILNTDIDNDILLILNSILPATCKVLNKNNKFMRHWLEGGYHYSKLTLNSRFPPLKVILMKIMHYQLQLEMHHGVEILLVIVQLYNVILIVGQVDYFGEY